MASFIFYFYILPRARLFVVCIYVYVYLNSAEEGEREIEGFYAIKDANMLHHIHIRVSVCEIENRIGPHWMWKRQEQ